MAVEPLDMRAGTEAALAKVVAVFGAARPHHAYLFANRRANRMKVTARITWSLRRHKRKRKSLASTAPRAEVAS